MLHTCFISYLSSMASRLCFSFSFCTSPLITFHPRPDEWDVFGKFEVLLLPRSHQLVKLTLQGIFSCCSSTDCRYQILVATKIEREKVCYCEIPRRVIILAYAYKQSPPMSRLKRKLHCKERVANNTW